ncbi:hypothetical protein [Pontiella desulfatans]|uniref:hypothetical protein n=1 Tax=Pontiella desulfatans TaxID=2750659 RepID=UPI00109CFBD8|nr:hypothetical protein [Pontiella desulfatans]
MFDFYFPNGDSPYCNRCAIGLFREGAEVVSFWLQGVRKVCGRAVDGWEGCGITGKKFPVALSHGGGASPTVPQSMGCVDFRHFFPSPKRRWKHISRIAELPASMAKPATQSPQWGAAHVQKEHPLTDLSICLPLFPMVLSRRASIMG